MALASTVPDATAPSRNGVLSMGPPDAAGVIVANRSAQARLGLRRTTVGPNAKAGHTSHKPSAAFSLRSAAQSPEAVRPHEADAAETFGARRALTSASSGELICRSGRWPRWLRSASAPTIARRLRRLRPGETSRRPPRRAIVPVGVNAHLR